MTRQPLYAVVAHDLAQAVRALEAIPVTGHATLDHRVALLFSSATATRDYAAHLADTTPKNWSAS